jgi:hypothetical protein
MKIESPEGSKTRVFSKSISIEPHQSYLLSWWCRTEFIERYISASIQMDKRTIDFESEYQGSSHEWLFHKTIFTTNEEDTACKINFQLRQGIAWIDNLKLEKYEKPLDSPGIIKECAQILLREGDSMAVWINYPAIKIFRKDLLSPALPETDTICIQMAKNEFESFQLVIHPAQDYSFIEIFASDLTGPGTISSENIMVNTVHYVWVDPVWVTGPEARSGFHPDALPRETETNTPSGMHTPFWITVKTPPEIPSGIYTGKIYITGSMGMEISIKVRVWDFTLPEIPNLECSVGDGILYSPKIDRYDKRPHEERITDMTNNLISHRIQSSRYVAATLDKNDWIELKDDSLNIDFALLDQTVQEYLNMGMQNFLLPPYSLAASGKPLGQTLWLGLTPLTEDFNRIFKDYCNRISKHLALKGWLDHAFFMLWDEPAVHEYEDVYKIYNLMRESDPRLQTMLTEEPVPELYDVIDIWFPNLRRLSCTELTERIQNQQAAGKTTGGYSNNRYSMLYPLTYQRLWPWTLKKYGLTRTGWFAVLDENKETSIWENPVIIPPGTENTAGLFPGRSYYMYFDPEGDGLFVNSMRWEALRDGAEDYEYLVELENRLDAVAPGTGNVLIQTLIDSLVWDNLGMSFKPGMAALYTIRDSLGNWIESLDKTTAIREKNPEMTRSNLLLKTKISCFPNPFNTSTKIQFNSSTEVQSIIIYDLTGKKIRTFSFQNYHSFRETIIWNGTDDLNQIVASGMYFLVIKHIQGTDDQKIILIK